MASQSDFLDLVTDSVNVNVKANLKFSYTNISVSGTTNIKSGAGVLHSITVNKKSTGSGVTLTVYDSLTGSGTTIATVDTTAGQATLVYDIAFLTGLTVVASSGSNADFTVAWV